MVFGRSKNGQLGWPAGQSLRFTDHSITDILDLLKCTILKMKLYKKTGDRVDHLEKLFLAHGGIMKTCELKEAGYYYKKIQSLIESCKIERVRQGYYQYVGEDPFSDIPVIANLFPDAVICMESALDYYGYTDRTPAAWHLAVKSTSARNRFHIDYPCVRPHFVQENRYLLGITTAVIDGTEVKIYDRERTMVDILFHRNKVDSEVFNTAVRRYIRDPEKKEAQLMRYAKVFHVERKVKEVLGVWL